MLSMWIGFAICAMLLILTILYVNFEQDVKVWMKKKRGKTVQERYGYSYGYDDHIGAVVLGFIAGIAAVAFLCLAILVPVCRHYDARQCGRKDVALNRPTKFVVYGSGWSWECLTMSRDGKWIPVDSLTEIRGDLVTHEGTPDTETTP